MADRKTWMIFCFGICLALLLASCRGSAPEPTPARLESRVKGYVASRQARDRETMRQFFLDPNQARVGNISYLASKIKNITINGKEAQVELRNRFQAMGFTFEDVPQKLKWRWENGDWYMVIDSRGNPFLQKKGAHGASKNVPVSK